MYSVQYEVVSTFVLLNKTKNA